MYQKKVSFYVELISKQKKYNSFHEWLKKFKFSDFFDKFNADQLDLTASSQIFAKKFQGLKLKVPKGELTIANHLEIADGYLYQGRSPLLVRVNPNKVDVWKPY